MRGPSWTTSCSRLNLWRSDNSCQMRWLVPFSNSSLSADKRWGTRDTNFCVESLEQLLHAIGQRPGSKHVLPRCHPRAMCGTAWLETQTAQNNSWTLASDPSQSPSKSKAPPDVLDHSHNLASDARARPSHKGLATIVIFSLGARRLSPWSS